MAKTGSFKESQGITLDGLSDALRRKLIYCRRDGDGLVCDVKGFEITVSLDRTIKRLSLSLTLPAKGEAPIAELKAMAEDMNHRAVVGSFTADAGLPGIVGRYHIMYKVAGLDIGHLADSLRELTRSAMHAYIADNGHLLQDLMEGE